ncbi:hypothetical protein [Bradyrhizobium sp. CCBAU 51627]|uniref:hypothetical protein n=1 Tax=Bradyrhizobium sp. CCBAU 51627 TaxID=1325088 RepID=UPI002306372A|nr:hypothetical protein [Bradyrhizobium sp. CCBAU 51627]MDA9431481.1 hypothetical protein [Bradyrhizobium sp. CCBAU 51627]
MIDREMDMRSENKRRPVWPLVLGRALRRCFGNYPCIGRLAGTERTEDVRRIVDHYWEMTELRPSRPIPL